MGRFTLCCVIAFIAIQTCSGASVRSHTELEELAALFAKASKNLAHSQDYIGKHITPIPLEFEYKIEKVVEDEAIDSVIVKLSNEITEIEGQISDELKGCVETARTQTTTLIEDTKTNIDECVSSARVVEGGLKQAAEVIDARATAILDALTTQYHKCLEQETDEDKVTCLNEVIYPIIDEVDDLDETVKEAHHSINHQFDEGVRHLKMCLQEVKHNAQSSSEKIISDLRVCVQVSEAAPPAIFTRGILDFFKDLKEKLDAIIHLATHLPTSISELQDKINEIIAHVNMHLLISQLKSEVNDIIDQGGRNAEKCRPPANKKMNDLMATSEAAATVCMEETEKHVDAIQGKISSVVNEGKSILAELNKKILTCMIQNPLNPIGFHRCLEGSYDKLKEQVAALQERTSAVVEECKNDAKETIQEFSKCMGEVQLSLIKNGQRIISETEECVRFA